MINIKQENEQMARSNVNANARNANNANNTNNANNASATSIDASANDDYAKEDEKGHVFEDAHQSNVLSTTMFFLHASHVSRARDLLSRVFIAYPKRDFLGVTFPRDSHPTSRAADGFTLVPPKPQANPFQELNVINRASFGRNEGDSFCVKSLTTESELKGIASLAWKVDANGPHTDVRSVLLDFKFVFDYGADPPESVETAIDVVNKITHLIGSDENNAYAYVATCDEEVVGYALVADGFIADEKHGESVREQYDVDGLINWSHYEPEEHGHIHHFVLSPVFLAFEKTFLQEIMRLSKKRTLFYPVYPLYAPNIRYGLLTCISRFHPVAPRETLQMPESVNSPIRNLNDSCFNRYALYHINKRLIHAERRTVTLRIVVVGGSTTGLSFLNSLLFMRDFVFTNLVLICPEGLPNELFPEPMMINLLKSVNKWSDLGHIALHSGVKLARGKVRAIDRVNKSVDLTDGSRVCYDLLVLTPGRQFYVPMPLAISDVDSFGVEVYLSDNEVLSQTASQLSSQRERRYPSPHLPRNAVVINTVVDAKALQRRLLLLFGDKKRKSAGRESSGRVLIYGRGVELLAAAATAFDAGVTAHDLVVVVDQPEEDDGIRTEEEIRVLSSLLTYLAKEGVKVLRGVLVEWTWRSESTRLHRESRPSVRLQLAEEADEKEERNIKCCRFLQFSVDKVGEEKRHRMGPDSFLVPDVKVFVCYSFRETDLDVFYGINHAGTLIYDGGITINHQFATPDPCVKAAGSAAVYARRFYASDEVQGRYCSFEVGERLAKVVARSLGSEGSFWDRKNSESSAEEPWSDTNGKLPRFKEPVQTRCTLINGVSYFHVRTANKRRLEAEAESLLKEAGTYDLKKNLKQSFSTGSIADLKGGKTKGYFYLGFDMCSRLSEILCLTKDSACASRLSHFRNLHGIHISYLNNLVERFREETLHDLYDFFADPWASALLDHKFQDFQRRFQAEGNPQRETWRNLAEQNLLTSSHGYDRMLSTAEISELTRPLRDFLLHFKSSLPMYASADSLYCRLAPKISKNYLGFMPMLDARVAKHRKVGMTTSPSPFGDRVSNRSRNNDSDSEDSSAVKGSGTTGSKTCSFLYGLRKERKIETIRSKIAFQFKNLFGNSRKSIQHQRSFGRRETMYDMES